MGFAITNIWQEVGLPFDRQELIYERSLKLSISWTYICRHACKRGWSLTPSVRRWPINSSKYQRLHSVAKQSNGGVISYL